MCSIAFRVLSVSASSAGAGARAYERPITKVTCLNHAPWHDNERQWQGNRSFVLP